jgi:GT2 family glycosyltransferase
MQAKTTISAIIPTYNRSAMLRECIDSILSQSRQVDEIIVVNDGSEDDTDLQVRSYGDRVKLISKPNGGKASALNLAMQHCTGDYVWICDDDDLAAPDGLAALAAALDADPSIGFAFGTFKIFRDEPSGRVFTDPTYWARGAEPNPKLNFLEEMFTFQFAMLVRRSLYQESGRFREDLVRSQDYDMAIRLSRHAKAVYVPQVIFFQRVHDNARGSKADLFAAKKSAEKWLTYDQAIFASVRDQFQLDEFVPTFALTWDTARKQRAALVQRACVFAQRAMWDVAVTDFRQATELNAGDASPQELDLVQTVIRNALAWDRLAANAGWLAQLRRCYDANAFGRQIILNTCRPLVWHARQMYASANITGGNRMLKTLVAAVGIGGTLARIRASLFG